MNQDLSRDMRLAYKVISGQDNFGSGDHFVRGAIEWLAQKLGDEFSDEVLGVRWCGDGWIVEGPLFSAAGSTLPEALCGAVFSLEME